MNPRPSMLHLNLFIMGCGHHRAAWRHPDSAVDRLGDIAYYEALARTAELRRAVYYSRSRGKLWFKGEESGHVQIVHDIRLDCDNDVVLLEVTQTGHEPGIACHTGRHSCFFKRHDNDTWLTVEPVLKDPASIYK